MVINRLVGLIRVSRNQGLCTKEEESNSGGNYLGSCV